MKTVDCVHVSIRSNSREIVCFNSTGACGIVYLTIHCSLLPAEERKVFIGMIPKTYTNEDLLRMLEPHGTIEELNILKSADGKSKGTGQCVLMQAHQWM